ncbi:MAG TPA: glycosyltransferase family 4 protein [Pyrinomonadaceae bacterium]|nr:glycosyltransferase family 4 protein [Pyrinomonadaceae bacterium]
MQRFEEISFQTGGKSSEKISADEKVKSKSIKVLIVAPTLDTALGGQSVQAARLLEKLNEEPNLNVGIQSIGPKFLPKLQRIKFLRTFITLLKFWFDILVKIPKYDIIHIFSAAHLSFLLTPTPAVLVAKLFGKKIILNYHSGQFNRHFANWETTLRPTLKLFDKIVVPSGYLVDIFGKHGFEARAIYNFVDVGRFPFRARKHPRPIFLSNRLLEELYNIGCILRAFAIIQKKYPDARLIVAGFGDRRESLENLARELKLRNVEFTGKIDQEKMPALYEEADIYLNSPNTDNMPVSIIESYACGIPIVTTNAGGIPYILEHGETGLTVGINDHEAMAREATRLLEDEKLAARLTENARRYVGKFTWEAVRLEWLDVYEKLAKEIVDKH